MTYQPTKCSFNDPTSGQHNEAFLPVGTLDDLQQQFPSFAQIPDPLFQLTGISAIGPQMAQSAVAMFDLRQDESDYIPRRMLIFDPLCEPGEARAPRRHPIEVQRLERQLAVTTQIAVARSVAWMKMMLARFVACAGAGCGGAIPPRRTMVMMHRHAP